ncbi:MAG: dephospho-CoA kinase [Candidatus Omnitrophica bacterium]|nr:dephospho-CoA kinase [Candidatus Omnitrophota bacterium]
MKIIGVTGSFGTGKTTVSCMFKRLGAVVFDADRFAHEALLERGIRNKLVWQFGRRILKADGGIDRRKLGKVVFTDNVALKKLCAAVHPYVIKKIKKGIQRLKRANKKATIVLDVPLLIETGMTKLVDKLIVVKTDKRTEIKRCVQATALSRKEILARIRAQMPIGEKIRKSDFVIDNSGTKQKTKREVKKVWQEIQLQAVRKKRI